MKPVRFYDRLLPTSEHTHVLGAVREVFRRPGRNAASPRASILSTIEARARACASRELNLSLSFREQ